MTAEGVLFTLLPVGLIVSWMVTGVLLVGAIRKPYIKALIERTIISIILSLVLIAYVSAVANAALAYPVPKEVFQIALRALFVAFVLTQIWFLYLYVTGKFDDGAL